MTDSIQNSCLPPTANGSSLPLVHTRRRGKNVSWIHPTVDPCSGGIKPAYDCHAVRRRGGTVANMKRGRAIRRARAELLHQLRRSGRRRRDRPRLRLARRNAQRPAHVVDMRREICRLGRLARLRTDASLKQGEAREIDEQLAPPNKSQKPRGESINFNARDRLATSGRCHYNFAPTSLSAELCRYPPAMATRHE